MYEYKCTLIRVIDADSCKAIVHLGFNIALTNETIRFYGIDTPESRINIKKYPERIPEKELGLKAKARLKEILPKKFIIRTQKPESRGKFGRVLGTVWTLDNVNICEQLIIEGLAKSYYGGRKQSWI
jgi:endonuclease YncB( thermonuclease family)